MKRRPVVSGLAVLSAVALVGLIVGGAWFNWRLRSFNTALAGKNTQLGQTNRKLAVSLEETRLNRERAVRNLYAADMDRAFVAIDAGLTSRAIELLGSYQNQEPGLPELRGFEWYYLRGLCSGGMRTIEAGGPVACMAASRDGRLLAGALRSTTQGKSHVASDLGDGDRPGRSISWRDTAAGSIAIAFGPDGTRMASASADGTVRVWDTSTGKPIVVFSGHEGVVNGVAFHPDGHRIASCGGKPAR